MMVSAVGPKLQIDLGLNDAEFGLVSTAFMLGYFVTSPFFGSLGDRFPRRGLIALGIATWSLATIGSGREGGALGTVFAKAGYPVMFSSRNPETLKDLVASAGPNAKAGTVAEAVAFADVVLIVGVLPPMSGSRMVVLSSYRPSYHCTIIPCSACLPLATWGS